MFIGTYYHTLESQSRISVPKTFRSDLSHGSVITHGLDGCLFMFTADSWSLLVDKLQDLPLSSKSARDFLRLFTYNATPIEMDKLGRTHFPDNLITLAGISKEVVFAGALTRVEVWAKNRYHAYVESLSGKESEIEEALKEIGI